jgi:hypothetical protein
MMAENKREDINRNPQQRRPDETRDPEREMPDPEQVERDIADAEKIYKRDQQKKPAA